MSAGSPPIRVLVVDDSAFARKVVREVLSAEPGLEVVGIARDGLDALEKIQQLTPDVVCLDLVMPGLDGLGVLDALQGKPGPRVVVVSTTPEDGELALSALQKGAVDIVQKPTALATDRLYEVSADLVAKVRIAAQAHPERLTRQGDAPAARVAKGAPLAALTAGRPPPKLVVLGASTGGPQALMRVLPLLPRDLPVPVAVVLHMPPGYTASLAQRLHDASAVDVVEAHDGVVFRPGLVVLARAGMHLKVTREEGVLRGRLDVVPLDTPHRPAVDVLFRSAAATIGRDVLAVVLTGMGQDGTEGARAIHDAGGFVVSEAEESCVVYGMPRAVYEAGLSDHVLPLGKIAATIDAASGRTER
ncbi:MAG TPA: chemotaxis response regulator protein-glutamate methylesterase [Polyangiaceae bacterium]